MEVGAPGLNQYTLFVRFILTWGWGGGQKRVKDVGTTVSLELSNMVLDGGIIFVRTF